MDFRTFIQRKRKRYLAQILSHFETNIEPLIPKTDTASQAINDHKVLVRMRTNALAVDAADAHEAVVEGVEINGYAQEIRDRLRARP